MEPCISCFYSHLLYGMCVKIFITNDQEYYWPTICRAGAAVVSTITRISLNNKNIMHEILQGLHPSPFHMEVPRATPTLAWETSWHFTMPLFDSLQKFQTDGASASNCLKICFIQLEALHRSWWWYLTSMEFLQTLVFYHLLNVSGKPRWRVSGKRLFGSFQQNVSGSNGTYKKFVLFFLNGIL